MFSVPLIQHTGDRAITLAAVRYSLECLDQTTSGVLSRIQAKTLAERKRLETINERIQALGERIAALQQDKSTALILTSMSVWPASAEPPQPTFTDASIQRLDLEPEIDSFLDDRGLHWRPAEIDSDPFVPVLALADLERRFRRAQVRLAELATPPQIAPSLSSTPSAPNDSDYQQLFLGELPPSLLLEEADEDEFVHEAVSYRPSVKEARQLGLPSNLNLPDIIVPTLNRLPANLNLPDIAAPPPVLVVPSPLIVPPPPAAAAASISLPSSSRTLEDDNDAATGSTPPLQDDDPLRKSLLDAIRGAPGKSRLKGASKPTRTTTTTTLSSPRKQQPPGTMSSLADEMREKLLRRQKALSGERDEEEQMAAQQASRRAARKPSKKKQDNDDDEDDDDDGSGTSSSSSPPPPASLPGGTAVPKRLSRTGAGGSKRNREDEAPTPAGSAQTTEDDEYVSRRFAGLDVLLSRELAKLPHGGKRPSGAAKSVLSGGSEWDS
jgi:hypothetical protein